MLYWPPKTNVVNVDANKTNINTVAANNANVTTVAGINANVTTVAGISSNVTTVAGINQTHLASVATSISTLNALSAMFAVADNITVTVVNDGGNKFAFNGITAPAITLVQGFTILLMLVHLQYQDIHWHSKILAVMLLLLALLLMAQLVVLVQM